jgi:N-formylmaleamate deformylase
MIPRIDIARALVVVAAALAMVAAIPPAVLAQSHPASAAASTPPFAVERIGRGRPMILIPGLLSGGEVWKSTVERYRDRYDMHVLTLAGFAGVPPLAGETFLAEERDAIIRYIREQRLEKPVIVGHSLGGFLAFWIAAAAPGLVGPIVAVDGVPYLPALNDSTMTPDKARSQAQQFRSMAANFSPEQLAMQNAMFMRSRAKDSIHAQMAARWGRGSDGLTMGRAVAEMMTTDLRAQVANIRTPVLLIAAGDGLTADMQNAVFAAYESQVSRVPRHRVVLANNARHFVMLDDPAFLFSAMDSFLEER